MKYTLGEIFRLGVIKNQDGDPYKDKGSVSKYLKRHKIKFKIKKTPWGPAKIFTLITRKGK